MNRQVTYSPRSLNPTPVDPRFGIGSPNVSPVGSPVRLGLGYGTERSLLTPTGKPIPPSSIKSFERYQKLKQSRQTRPPSGVSRPGPSSDEIAGGVLGILGPASLAAPSILPVVAAAGVGYGVYRLGHTFDLW